MDDERLKVVMDRLRAEASRGPVSPREVFAQTDPIMDEIMRTRRGRTGMGDGPGIKQHLLDMEALLTGEHTVTLCEAQVRWVKNSDYSPVSIDMWSGRYKLQQQWSISHWKDGEMVDCGYEWRDVPIE